MTVNKLWLSLGQGSPDLRGVGRLKILIGTDAASTGLNLQKLGSLINLDLPWNSTLLEQRKGRVQRGTIAKRIPFYNMRYDKGVEQRLLPTVVVCSSAFGTMAALPASTLEKCSSSSIGSVVQGRRLSWRIR